jgi:exosome complex RNA-binding protein Rrp42 (RNase PH superfamily)
MTTLLEDLGLALRQICRAIGLTGTALTVIPLVVLGVAMNMAALSAVRYMRNQKHSDCKSTALRSATQTELKVMRTVLVSTLKKVSGGQLRWCVARQWLMDRQTKDEEYHLEASLVWPAPNTGQCCDVEVVGSHRWKTAIAFVQC